jgi:2-methylcitrate dehydratase PrpD
MGVTEQLAKFAIDPPAAFLTPKLIESVTERFLDTIGIMVAGANSPASRVLLKTVSEAGGTPEATVIGTSVMNSVVHAGFVNGVSAHALEYDDLTPDITHLSSSLVPGCLAAAEKLNLSGRQLVEAFALGFEVAGRVGLGLKPLAMLDRGFHTPGVLGGLGVAVAGSRLMGLDATATRMAIGLMASSGAGIRKNVGSPGKAFHIGNGVRAGLQAATLAANNFQVDPDAIEGIAHGHGHERFGFAESYAGSGNYDLEKMVENLGGEFALTRIPTMVRMHPCSTVNCVGIDGMIELATQHELHASDVEKVDVACHPRLLMIAPYTEPTDSYRAKFCPPYTFAAALVDRHVGLAQFSDDRIRDPQILGLMRRIEVRARDDIKEDHGWCNGEDNWCAVRISIRLKDGRTLGGHYSQAKGWPARPASWDDLQRKYEECTDGILPELHVRDSVAMIRDLVELRSVRELVRLLAGSAATPAAV